MYSKQELAGVCGDHLFGLHVLPNWLRDRNYKAFMENSMPVFLADVPLIIPRELHFMQDGAAGYFSLMACRYLNRKFLGQSISTDGRTNCVAWTLI
jgi:hypothetical protein